MKLAVMSDVHGRLEAYDAALADAEANGVDKIVCLGDLIGGGGANPSECVERTVELRERGKLEACVLGNSDRLVLAQFGWGDRDEAVFWSRERLEAELPEKATARWDFFSEAFRAYKKGGFLFVHGSPNGPRDEPVYAAAADDVAQMEKLFALTPRYCFLGHTHVPGVFVAEQDGSYRYVSAAELKERGSVFPLDERKMMVNVGSVGEPRDESGACYVIVRYDENGADNEIEYRFIEF